jgi:hypothetical protein
MEHTRENLVNAIREHYEKELYKLDYYDDMFYRIKQDMDDLIFWVETGTFPPCNDPTEYSEELYDVYCGYNTIETFYEIYLS